MQGAPAAHIQQEVDMQVQGGWGGQQGVQLGAQAAGGRSQGEQAAGGQAPGGVDLAGEEGRELRLSGGAAVCRGM